MHTGWTKIDGLWYYLKPRAMHTAGSSSQVRGNTSGARKRN